MAATESELLVEHEFSSAADASYPASNSPCTGYAKSGAALIASNLKPTQIPFECRSNAVARRIDTASAFCNRE